ncbi:hypothetical protein [Dokdonia sp.]|uniref:hypothetical protein n=1 Tax=Dokdonia sp. TaxID=2024995 RepID=UPI0032665797
MDRDKKIKELESEINDLIYNKLTSSDNAGNSKVFLKKLYLVSPNWFTKFIDRLFYARRLWRDKAECIFTLIRYAMFLLITLSLVYSVSMFFNDIKGIVNYSNTKDYSKQIVDSLKLNIEKSIRIDTTLVQENLKLKDEQIKILLKTIENESEQIVKVKSNKKDLESLKIIEHIFVYLLPFLVLLGLYYYFESNFKTKLINSGSTDIEDIKQSKNNLNTTKTLFISSMMSYTVIKIIEKLFIEKSSGLDLKYLVAYGIFLLLLMMYLILSHNHSLSEDEKNKKH